MERPGRAPVSLPAARQALHDGTAVVLPNPAPLTHVVAARSPRAVNEAKGRPAAQPVALWAHHPDTLRVLAEDIWRLGPRQSATARRLLAEEHLTVLVPVRGHTPATPGRPRPSRTAGCSSSAHAGSRCAVSSMSTPCCT
ncbi:hypothetical protein AB6O49_31255 [Streptomyces sp. SBR177]